MNTTQICDQCGAALPDDSPRGLCPACMMRAALQTTLQSADGRSASETSAETPPKNSVPAPGSRLQYFGDYELLEKIAQGGMGVVYKARQVSLNRVVAVKMILAGQLANEMEVKRFRLEAEAAANLQHPNIVAIHEVGSHEGQDYFSMDFVPGQNLADAVADGPIEARRAAEWVATIAEAIQYAHQRGILHRDLKPQNVLLDERTEPRVTDFGLAKRLVVPPSGGSGPIAAATTSELTVTGAVMGSPSYMAPEQAAGRQSEIGPATDVYALGAILYCLITGKPPFTAETPVATMVKVLNDEPASPRKLNPAIPVDIENVCLKCLEKKPERRYATARALAEDLQRFLNHEPVLARPVSAARKVWSWSRRNPWVMVLGMAVALFVLLGAVFWLQTENEFLRYKSTHPEPDGHSTRIYEKLVPLFRGVVSVLVISLGVFCVGGAMAASSALGRYNLSPGARSWINAAMPLWLIGVCLVFGILILQRGVEAHIWNGHPVLLPASIGFVLLYFGVHFAVELATLHRRGALAGAGQDLFHRAEQPPNTPKQRLFENFFAGFAELGRGDLEGFWRKAVPRPEPRRGRPLGDLEEPHWRITWPRLANLAGMCGLSIWVGNAVGREHGNSALIVFLVHLAIGTYLNGLYWSMKSGRMSSTRATLSAGATLLFPALTGMLVYSQLAILWNGAPDPGAQSLQFQYVIGMLLGLAAAFQLLRWRTNT